MSAERDAMIQSLKKNLIPVVKERGFRGSFPHFYREMNDKVDLLNFQFSMYGGRLYVNIKICPLEGILHPSKNVHLPPNKVKTYQVTDPGVRMGDYAFDRHNTEKVSFEMLTDFEAAEKWWAGNGDFSAIQKDTAKRRYNDLFEIHLRLSFFGGEQHA